MRLLCLPLIGLLPVLFVRDAQACDCGTPEPTVAEGLGRLSVVVAGRVTSLRDIGDRAYTIDLLVERSWKGPEAGRVVSLPIDASSCGFHILPGEELLIYAPVGEPAQQCAGDRTARIRVGPQIAADLHELGAPASVANLPTPTAVPGKADVVAEAKVEAIDDGLRIRYRLRVVREKKGARRGEFLSIVSPVGACEVRLDVAKGTRLAVTARNVGGLLVVSRCLGGTGLTKLRSRR